MSNAPVRIVLLLIAMVVGSWFVWTHSLRGGVVIETPSAEDFSRVCSNLLGADDFIKACPSAVTLQGLRVRTDAVSFPKLSKCSVSVSARGSYTFYASVDIFRDAASAFARFHQRTKNMVDGPTVENVTTRLVVAPGNELGFGEASALHHARGAPEFDLQREYVYTEIASSGGFLCSDEDFRSLGRLFYERALRFKPHGA